MRHALAAVLLIAGPALAADGTPQLFQRPALSAASIVFHHAGDLWTVARNGGEARRLTSGPGIEDRPVFSPDGRWIAFTGEYDGNVDVFVMPSSGGIPRRLTWHPAADIAVGWTGDGRSILFRSSRNSHSRFNRLFTLPIDGVLPAELPLPMAEEGCYSPDGSRIAYEPLSRPFRSWKRYRGGQTSSIWLARLSDSSVERIPRDNTNDFNPMWVENRIYFLSDRNGAFTLFSFDTQSKQVRQELTHSGLDLKAASAGPGAIVYEQFGGLHLFDLRSRKTSRVPITLSGDFPEVRPRIERVDGRIQSATISPTGARALFEARGEIYSVPAEKGDARNLTASAGAAERNPSWSPDGKWVAYFSDASGEYELHLRDPQGKGDARKLRLSDPPTYYYAAAWSPDSTKFAFTDKKLNLAYLEMDSGKVTKVDTDRYDGPRRIGGMSWSPDSRWIAYTKQLKSTLRAVFVYSLQNGSVTQVTDGMSDATSPVFDADGKHLYFLATTDLGLNIGWRDMSAYPSPSHRKTGFRAAPVSSRRPT